LRQDRVDRSTYVWCFVVKWYDHWYWTHYF